MKLKEKRVLGPNLGPNLMAHVDEQIERGIMIEKRR